MIFIQQHIGFYAANSQIRTKTISTQKLPFASKYIKNLTSEKSLTIDKVVKRHQVMAIYKPTNSIQNVPLQTFKTRCLVHYGFNILFEFILK